MPCVASATQPEDMARNRKVAQWLSGPDVLPIAFTYDGEAVTGIPMDWKPLSRQRRIDANIVETVFGAHDPGPGCISGWSVSNTSTIRSSTSESLACLPFRPIPFSSSHWGAHCWMRLALKQNS